MFMSNENKKILIVGSSAKEYALAKHFYENENIHNVFVAPGNQAVSEFATRLDLRETDTSALLEFAIKNDIDLTIVSSASAIQTDIATDFRENSQMIFAPDKASSMFAVSKCVGKKYAYKMHLPQAKFGIFEKSQLAIDYAKNEIKPLIISSEFETETSIKTVCNTVQTANTVINDLFLQNNEKVIIEQYVYGHTFTLYVITDGYQILPLAAVGDYKFQEDGDGGIYTSGMGAYVPDYKISSDLVNKITDNVAKKILNNLSYKGTPYLGILGIELVLDKNSEEYTIMGFTPFLKEHDAQAVLNSIDLNIYALMEACANGSFADDYDDIPIKDLSIISCVLSSRNNGSVITGLELVDDTTDISYFNTTKNKYMETLTNAGRTMVITQTAATFTRARELLYDNIETINFNGIKYRKDLCLNETI